MKTLCKYVACLFCSLPGYCLAERMPDPVTFYAGISLIIRECMLRYPDPRVPDLRTALFDDMSTSDREGTKKIEQDPKFPAEQVQAERDFKKLPTEKLANECKAMYKSVITTRERPTARWAARETVVRQECEARFHELRTAFARRDQQASPQTRRVMQAATRMEDYDFFLDMARKELRELSESKFSDECRNASYSGIVPPSKKIPPN